MKLTFSKEKLLAGTLLAGLTVAGPAIAQPSAGAAPKPTSETESSDTVVITGSHIARPGESSISPIATVGAAELQAQQPVNIEEVLRDQPQFASGNGAQVNNGSLGVSTLDLRGLSTPRTLPLIDGHRMVAFDPNGLFDVSAVPVALLKRVDVVTGGASAVYGSDAIAGVVNFILNDNFQGVDMRASHSYLQDSSEVGHTDNASVTMGTGLDNGRGNAVLSMGYLNRDPVYQTRSAAALAPGASSTTVPAAFDSASGPRQQLDASGNLVPFYHGFDFNGQNLYQSPQKRWNATAVAHFDINEHVEAYSHFIYNNSYSAPQLASTGTFGRSFELPINNPFLTPATSAYLQANNAVFACSVGGGLCVKPGFRWRAVAIGPRQYAFQYDTFQSLFGFRGDFGKWSDWKWDISGAHGETSLKRQQNNDLNGDRFQQALYATSTTTCFDPSNFCAPINIFNPSQTPSAASIAFVSLNLQVQSQTKQDYVTGVVNGDLGSIKSPLASSPIALSFGSEYRAESTDYRPDFASQAGISPGFGQTLPVKGKYDVLEFFGEALVPLIEDRPWVKSANLELGYRTSDYSTSGQVESYKAGLDWAPVEDIRFRGMFQRAVRAPNLQELFNPNTPGTGDLLVDPCAGIAMPTATPLRNLCQATGVPLAKLIAGTLAQPTSGQTNNFSGGNPNLSPEQANTFTFGVVVKPKAIRSLSATLDYFDIKVNHAISIRPEFDVTDGCYNLTRNTTANAAAADCLLVKRNTTDGSLEGDPTFGVVQGTQNIGQVHVEGIDYGVNYTWDLDNWGSLALSLDGTHELDTSYSPSPGSGTVSCVGFYGKTCGLPDTVAVAVGGPVLEDRWVQRSTWTTGRFDFSYRWRHLSDAKVDTRTQADGTITGTLDPKSISIPAFDYIDLSAGWQATSALRFDANITNITDQDAPFVATGTGSTPFNSGNTYPSTYDVLGRVVTIGAKVKF